MCDNVKKIMRIIFKLHANYKFITNLQKKTTFYLDKFNFTVKVIKKNIKFYSNNVTTASVVILSSVQTFYKEIWNKKL